ncbi:MAG: PepSY domain-containing protein [Candidatus Sericytochromatia bacterium]|nr:PepSY domain-containing protein [Candidatus Sericytochromatia bacterium]
MTRFWRVGHRWLGVLAAVVLMSSAITGWLMLHETWLQGRDLSQVAADPKEAAHLLAAGPQGFWRSTDSGAHWADVTMPVPTTDVTALTAGAPGFAVAFRDFGVWRSTDGYIWDRVADVPDGERIKGVSFLGNDLVYLTDAALIVGSVRHDQDRSWLRRIHEWHTGWALGRTGTLIVEAGAIAMILLTISGMVLFIRTRVRRRPNRPAPMRQPPVERPVEAATSIN